MLRAIFSYVKLYVFLVLSFISLLYLSSILPTPERTYFSSACFFQSKANQGKNIWVGNNFAHPKSVIQYIADEYDVSIAYEYKNADSIADVLRCNFYDMSKENSGLYLSLLEAIRDDKSPNSEYMRYWHGDVPIIRFMHVLFDINMMYLINLLVLSVILLYLLYLLYKNHHIDIAIVLAISLYIESFHVVPQCFEYSWVFYN